MGKKKELQDKNISHYLLSTIFLIPRLSIHHRPSVSIEMCPRHQQAAHTLCPYKAIPLRGRLQCWWVGERGERGIKSHSGVTTGDYIPDGWYLMVKQRRNGEI
jgi:hypothetical protein